MEIGEYHILTQELSLDSDPLNTHDSTIVMIDNYLPADSYTDSYSYFFFFFFFFFFLFSTIRGE